MKSRTKMMNCKETAQTRSKSLLEHHMLNRSYIFITEYIVSVLKFQQQRSCCVVNE